MHLYTIAKDVKWVPGPYFDIKPSERTEELYNKSSSIFLDVLNEADKKFGKDFDSLEKDLWIDTEYNKRDPLYMGRWSDGKDHDTFDFYKCSKKSLNNRNKRDGKYQNLAKQYFGEYIQSGYGKYDNSKYLVLDEIFYRQGWFFTDKLFNSSNSIFYAFDRDMAIRLAKRLINISTDRGKEAYDSLIEEIKEFKKDEHFIFEIAW